MRGSPKRSASRPSDKTGAKWPRLNRPKIERGQHAPYSGHRGPQSCNGPKNRKPTSSGETMRIATTQSPCGNNEHETISHGQDQPLRQQRAGSHPDQGGDSVENIAFFSSDTVHLCSYPGSADDSRHRHNAHQKGRYRSCHHRYVGTNKGKIKKKVKPVDMMRLEIASWRKSLVYKDGLLCETGVFMSFFQRCEGMSDGAPAGFEPAAHGLGIRCSIP